MNNFVTVIGAGLGGCEAALTLASRGIRVRLFEAKPKEMSPAHHSADFAEVVCSNSFKSDDPYSASGLLKAELRLLGSKLLSVADSVKVPAGGALAVNREMFSAKVTRLIESEGSIEVVPQKADRIAFSGPVIIATGPLTLEPLGSFLSEIFGKSLYFYDAAAPIVSGDSIDRSASFKAGRYDQGDDYINCPLTKEEYYTFVEQLVAAERVTLKDFEKKDIFEGCMPIEIMAARGADTLRFGPLKPVGITAEDGKKPFAVVQLRCEDESNSMYNLVGFQTNLKFGEQKRVFGLIPALKNANFLRYGVMHRNMYIDAPRTIDSHFRVLAHENCFVAGQLSGVEGYVESIASGHIAALNAERLIKGQPMLDVPRETMIGALCCYLERKVGNFQPMNANFGLLPPLKETIRDRQKRNKALTERALNAMNELRFTI